MLILLGMISLELMTARLGHMEVVLPQRLAMHKRRGEEIEEHASSVKLCNTVPWVNWEMRVVGCGLPCVGCSVYSCSSNRPGSSVSCPFSSLLLCCTFSSLSTALSCSCCCLGSFSCILWVRHTPAETGAVPDDILCVNLAG